MVERAGLGLGRTRSSAEQGGGAEACRLLMPKAVAPRHQHDIPNCISGPLLGSVQGVRLHLDPDRLLPGAVEVGSDEFLWGHDHRSCVLLLVAKP